MNLCAEHPDTQNLNLSQTWTTWLKVNTYQDFILDWFRQAAFSRHLPDQSVGLLLRLRAQRVDVSHPQFKAVQEVFRQAVPVLRQMLPMLENGLHAEPGQGADGQK